MTAVVLDASVALSWGLADELNDESSRLFDELRNAGHPASSRHIAALVPLARSHNLTAYDAAYLELALRHRAALATFDTALRKAARKAGVSLLTARP